MTSVPLAPNGGLDTLDAGLLDRASGVLMGQACGDALGLPYEFATPPRYGEEAVMRGGGIGQYGPGEWGDDTQLAICVANVAATSDLTDDDSGALDAVASAFEKWKVAGATDIGRHTAAVLRNAQRLEGSPAERLIRASYAMNRGPGLMAGNGALMRAGAAALVALDDRAATAHATRQVARLTHDHPVAIDACILWTEAVRLAVTECRLDIESGLDLIPAERRLDWLGWLADASKSHPSTGLRANGFSVTALQAAWHAITVATPPRLDPTRNADHVVAALQAVIRIGGDTDTTGAIAGALLGARYGAAALPAAWKRALYGWPGMRARELGALARAVVQRDLDWAGSRCPLCGTALAGDPRYPDALCRWCVEWATDENGRPVHLYNASLEGGYTAQYDDGACASPSVLSGRVWIEGCEYRAVEGYFGGVVVIAEQSDDHTDGERPDPAPSP